MWDELYLVTDKMLARIFWWVIIVISGLISLGLAQSECAVCENAPFLDKYFSKSQRAVDEINSQLRRYPLVAWEKPRAVENLLFPVKYSFSKLMWVLEWWNIYLDSSKVIFRDIKNFDKIDQAIRSGAFNILGTNVVWNKVPKEFLNKFLAGYQTLGVIKIEYIGSTTNWEDLFNMLWAINFINRHYRAKSALGEGYQPILSGQDLINLFNQALGGKIKISLYQANIRQLQDEYKCFVEEYGICEKSANDQDILQRVKKIVDSFSKQGAGTIEKFTTSFNRLKEALQKFDSTGGFWHKNWVTLNAKLEADGVSLVDHSVMGGKLLGFSWAEIASKVFEKTQLEKLFGDAMVNNMPDNLDLLRVVYLSWSGIEDSLKRAEKEKQVTIQQSLEKLDFVLKKAIKQDIAIGTSWEPRMYTIEIVNISDQIHKVLEIIGSRDKENSLIRLLGNACELQCGNLGGKCWAE